MPRIPLSIAKSIKGAMLAAATVAAAGAFLPGAVTTAEAKGVHGHRHVHVFKHRHVNFHRHRFVGFYGPSYVVASGYGCGWLKARAISTGLPYWWNRYHACRGE
jgi:hypothetical protein